jgi:hypothetical protein
MSVSFGASVSSGGLSPSDKTRARSTIKSLVSKEKIGGVFDDVPDLVLEADDVNMSVWAVLCTDDTLRRIASIHSDRIVKRRRALRLSKADKISDVGVKTVAEALGSELLVCVSVPRPVSVCMRITLGDVIPCFARLPPYAAHGGEPV